MLTRHYLRPLLEPQSIAVVGASENEASIGNAVLRNIYAGGYEGRVWPVNPRHSELLGRPCVASLEDIDGPCDVAIVATAPRGIPQIIDQCGRSGIRHAVVITNPAEAGASAAMVEQRIHDMARSHGVRLLGPKSIGVIRPALRLNATFAGGGAVAGDLALVAQSGAMCAAVVDWAVMNRIGISSACALGNAADIDFGDILDYLVYDEQTRYILLHVERVRNARRFMSSLRSAARAKPIILLKSGHAGEHGGTQALDDAVFDAAIRRAGVVRVRAIGQLFHAAKALASGFRPRGDHLAIMSNGTGPGAMAADAAKAQGVPLAQLAPDTVAAMKRFLPSDWNGTMPIDLGGDATPERYLATIAALAADPAVHATLVVLSPLAMARPADVARGIVAAARERALTLCCSFMGGEQIAEARRILEDAGIPVFRTPDTVIELFSNISRYYRSQELLLQAPAQSRPAGPAGTASGRALVEALVVERRTVLSAMEARALLRSFGIPAPQVVVARTPTEAMFAAEHVGMPVTMRIEAPDLPRDAAGADVRSNVIGVAEVRTAFGELQQHARTRLRGAADAAVAIEHQPSRPGARALSLAVVRDPAFGPVIRFGAGGPLGHALLDPAACLPPLNAFLARDLIESTRVSRMLAAFHGMPPADLRALEGVLLAVSDMACELPWLRELEIDPLQVDGDGAWVADVRVVIDHAGATGDDRYAHLAIHPYPSELCQEWLLEDGVTVSVRPVRPEDAPLEQAFVRGMSDESRRFRFMDATRSLSPGMIARFTQVDYDREMALIATVRNDGEERQIGSARYTQAPDGETVEFALAIADEWQKFGLGRRLMGALIQCARAKGYRHIVGDVLADNAKMLRLMGHLGFAAVAHPDDTELKRVVLPLST